jgi:hypothetical protein
MSVCLLAAASACLSISPSVSVCACVCVSHSSTPHQDVTGGGRAMECTGGWVGVGLKREGEERVVG